MKSFTVRIEDDVYDELKKLSSLSGQSMNCVISSVIRETYDKLEGDPKVKLALQQMNELKSFLENMNAKLQA